VQEEQDRLDRAAGDVLARRAHGADRGRPQQRLTAGVLFGSQAEAFLQHQPQNRRVPGLHQQRIRTQHCEALPCASDRRSICRPHSIFDGPVMSHVRRAIEFSQMSSARIRGRIRSRAYPVVEAGEVIDLVF
jgi:hypothetical protein